MTTYNNWGRGRDKGDTRVWPPIVTGDGGKGDTGVWPPLGTGGGGGGGRKGKGDTGVWPIVTK